jgi:CheY-like chemotaxis protein
MSWDLTLRGLAVLVVDDHEDSLDLTATVLRFAGAQVSTASSGHQALAQLSLPCDLVITDISMPDGTGYDLIRDARRTGSRVAMIALTALDTPEERLRILSSGFICHLTKPLLPERLIAAVWEVARMPGAASFDDITRLNGDPLKAPSGAPHDSTE